MDRDQRPLLQSLALSVAMMIAALGVLVVVLVVGVDSACVRDADQWLRVDPAGQRIDVSYDGLRAYGIGATDTVLQTPAPLWWAVVWYTWHLGQAPQTVGVKGMVTVYWSLAAAADGSAQILIQTRCAQA